MNTLIFSSGLLCLFTSLVHIIGGQIDPVRPFLKSDLADIPKAVLLACWHMVSVTLVFSSILLLYVGWYSIISLYSAIMLLSGMYVIFALVFLIVGFYFFRGGTFTKLPQWILLLPIGILGVIGVMY